MGKVAWAELKWEWVFCGTGRDIKKRTPKKSAKLIYLGAQ